MATSSKSKINWAPSQTNIRAAKRASTWGMLPGYSYENGSSTSWERSTKYIREFMNDGVLSDSAVTRKLTHWTKFDRFYSVDLERESISGRHYVFILRPDLYLIEPGSGVDGKDIVLSRESRVNRDPYFIYLAVLYPEIIASLTGDFGGLGSTLTRTSAKAATGSGYGNAATEDGTKLNGFSLPIHTFIPYLTSRVENVQLPDFILKTNTLVQPYTKYSIPYTQSGIESLTGGQVDITFREDRDLSLHKLFYAWTYYQDKVMRDIFTPKKKYLQYNAIDYATSIYDFMVDETGENVIYWAKYTGCVPYQVPMSDLGFNRGSDPDKNLTIQFNYFYCEHMDLDILRDFQYNSLGYIYMKSIKKNGKNGYTIFKPCSLEDTEPMFNQEYFLGPNLNGRPVLIFVTANDGQKYIKLRWLKTNA